MNFAKTLLAVVVANIFLFVCGFFLLFVIGAVISMDTEPSVKSGSWLYVDIYGDVLAYDPPESIESELLGGSPETVHRILSNLEKATVDDRVAGVLLRISSHNSLGMASMQEIRRAVGKVRDAGKPVIAFSDDLNRNSLFLASACDSVFMPPGADVTFVGMAMVREYYKGTLDKLDVKDNLHKIADYKTAAEMMQRRDMSPEAREMANWILDELWDMQLSAISGDRGISMEQLEALMGRALFTADEAREAGLIDGVAYWDDMVAILTGGDDIETVNQDDYEDVTRESVGLKGSARIAVVHAQGTIGGRKSRLDPYFGPMMGHQTMAEQLREAREDDKIRAVVLRIDSPGGETLASDLIAAEVERTAEVKPVVVSMLDVAASGGYYIAYKATRMVADPMTITGSIGSIAGKMNTAGFYRKLGVSFDTVTKGPNGLLWSGITDFTPAQRKLFVEHHVRGFDRWLDDVAARRGMTVEEAEKLAMGRVWTGRQAVENGLIDGLGGLDVAIDQAKEAAGLSPSEEVTLIDYPRRKGLLHLLTSEGPFALVRLAAYRFIREDMAQTWWHAQRGNYYVWPWRLVN